ncbi:hypothetical protein [Nocardia sp. NPDC050710]|uniref:hypothetical protein n=1 Tax=Nocardia sp. NPDC050710 TaxID=3157220 RepID=UPI0033CE3AF3
MAAQDIRPRPGSADTDTLKLHRRTMVLDGRLYSVLTLRPGGDVRFATNRYHNTWHVLSDWRGARVLARLLWGLAYQRRPGTLVVIDPGHLDPNPFDAATSDPIVLVPSDLTVFTRAAAVALRKRLPLRDRSAGTVRWQTFGLKPALARWLARRSPDPGAVVSHYVAEPVGWTRIDRLGGLLVIYGAADHLRDWATCLMRLGTYAQDGMDYLYLDYPVVDGEVQIFRQYRREVNIARQARREVLARTGGRAEPGIESAIWSHAATVRHRRYPPPAGPVSPVGGP